MSDISFAFVFPFGTRPPIRRSRSSYNESEQASGLAELQRVLPHLRPTPQTDFEDFWEAALPLVWALDAGHPVRVLEPGGQTIYATHGASPANVWMGRIPVPRHRSNKWWERYAQGPPRWPDDEQLLLAERYPFSPAFERFAGRLVQIAGIPTHGGDGGFDRWIAGQPRDTPPPGEALLRLHRHGVRRVFIKVNLPKYLTAEVELPDRMDLADAGRLLDQALDSAVLFLEGYGDILLIQQCVPMTKEYRCVVVGGEVCSAAGAVPDHTPLDRSPNEGVWGREVLDRGMIAALSDQELAAYRRLAKDATRAFAQEGLQHYILDLAMADGRPLVVELNPIMNWGWYSNSVPRVMQAIIGASATAR